LRLFLRGLRRLRWALLLARSGPLRGRPRRRLLCGGRLALRRRGGGTLLRGRLGGLSLGGRGLLLLLGFGGVLGRRRCRLLRHAE
jgi:hypothetical protein